MFILAVRSASSQTSSPFNILTKATQGKSVSMGRAAGTEPMMWDKNTTQACQCSNTWPPPAPPRASERMLNANRLEKLKEISWMD